MRVSFCKDSRTDHDIFNWFLITERSDSKPLVPDLVPAWKGSCALCSWGWHNHSGTGEISRSFLIPNARLWILLAKPRRKRPKIWVVLDRLPRCHMWLCWFIDTAALAEHHLEHIWWFFINFWLLRSWYSVQIFHVEWIIFLATMIAGYY